MNPKIILIDGHALAYRMFFALPLDAFTTEDGEPTNATYGFTRTLLDRLLSEQPPEYFAVSFDLGRTFRDDMFAEYKGTREKMPDELRLQIERIKEVVRAFNIPILELEGFEADDVLGTVARQVKDHGVKAHIITGDRDLLQLVDDNTAVELPPSRGSQAPKVYDISDVVDYFGVLPKQVVDWKAMVGDSSDNIPGIKGVGQKTATRLLQQYGTLDDIYEHIDSIKGAMGKKIREGKESAYLSYKLAKIVTDAPIALDLESCRAQDFDHTAVLDIFRELEFRTLTRDLLERLGEDSQEADISEQPPTKAILVNTPEQLKDLAEKLDGAKMIGFDVETTGLDKMTAEVVGICLSMNPPTGYYIPVGHLDQEKQAKTGQMSLFAGEASLAPGQLALDTVLAAIKPAMINPAIPKVAHNAKYDYTILDLHGLHVSPITFDTMIAEFLNNPASKHKGLKDLARHRLGIEMTPITKLIGTGRKQKSFAEVPIEAAAPYGAADADLTLRLVAPLQEEIEQKGLEKILELEMPLIEVLSDMERTGVRLDKDFLAGMSLDIEERLKTLEKNIYEIAGAPFNVNSTQQLSDVLFKKLDLPHEGLRKTKSGHYSTAANVLEDLRKVDTTGIINAITEYRELGKLKSTYVDALPQMVNPNTGRIHTSYNQTGAVTGRIASSNPNLQNIPIRSKVGQQIRRGFITEEGWLFLAADYSQVELRVLAHISQDAALLEAFHQDQDIHRTTAAAVYGVGLDDVTYDQRRFAKAVNFGLIYGMGAFRLARDSDLTLSEAESYITEYFARFPGIQRYLDETKEKARELGYVETLFGRRRYFPIFKVPASGSNRQAMLRAEREAVNHPIQGTAADIIKIAMLQLHDSLANYQSRMVLQVHDELVLEVPENELDVIRPLVIDVMSNAVELDVSLKVDASSGTNWLELKG
ncbi:MAG: DNA polymerase I [Candidatus Promineifilaceae bacterium]|nr:DNA polymerase I [Candidatus Promineifilaceae bacterium]